MAVTRPKAKKFRGAMTRNNKINYPCLWSYRVIGPDKGLVKTAVLEIFCDLNYSLRPGNASRTGKYHSWGVSLEVKDQAQRDILFQRLSSHPDIKVVI